MARAVLAFQAKEKTTKDDLLPAMSEDFVIPQNAKHQDATKRATLSCADLGDPGHETLGDIAVACVNASVCCCRAGCFRGESEVIGFTKICKDLYTASCNLSIVLCPEESNDAPALGRRL